MVELTGTDFKKIYFPKYREFQDVTEDTVKDAKRCSDTFHDFLVNSPFFSGVSCFRVYDNDLFSFYKQAERCLKSGRTSSLDMADCKIKPNTLHKKTAETLMVID
ncbi:hypothetical protein [Leuconostoc mesenteroides]|uniref:hypothetical protein n=2 Tax=Leuconostoc mesenteroides TaxID=1245 RepID=UPI0023612AE3|nr:hypothetical protein [Leuconostoc mesenteroides]